MAVESDRHTRRTAAANIPSIPEDNNKTRPNDFNLMSVDILLDSLEIIVFTEEDHTGELAKICLKELKETGKNYFSSINAKYRPFGPIGHPL